MIFQHEFFTSLDEEKDDDDDDEEEESGPTELFR